MDEENNKRTNNVKKIMIGVGFFAVIGLSINYKIEKDNNFTRIVNENGDYELEGYISYDELNKYKVIEVETITGDVRIYIAKVGMPGWEYNEIITGKEININSNVLLSNQDIDNFLLSYDMVKGKYSEDDILELLDKIKYDYKNNENLKLVKKQ